MTTRTMHELVEVYMDVNDIHSLEGSRGVRHFTKLVSAIGYRSLEAFLEDNSGAMEAMINWIQEQRAPEWTALLEQEVPPAEEDEE